MHTVSWSPNGHLVATAGGGGQVQLFDIRTFRELDSMKGHEQDVHCKRTVCSSVRGVLLTLKASNGTRSIIRSLPQAMRAAESTTTLSPTPTHRNQPRV